MQSTSLRLDERTAALMNVMMSPHVTSFNGVSPPSNRQAVLEKVTNNLMSSNIFLDVPVFPSVVNSSIEKEGFSAPQSTYEFDCRNNENDKPIINKKLGIDANQGSSSVIIVDESVVTEEMIARKRNIQNVILNDASNDGGSLLSDNGRAGKYSRTSDDSNLDNQNGGGISQGQDNGSRGTSSNNNSGPKQVTLKNYFHIANENTSTIASVSMVTTSLSSPPTSSTTNQTAEISPPGKDNSSAKKEKSTSKTTNSSGNKQSSQASNASSSNPNSSASSTQIQNQIQDLKRQLDLTKQQRDQNESKVNRLEAEIKVVQDAYKVLEERNNKLCKYVEQVYREMAIQDARRKRDKLALDCVRLGKISTIRSGSSFNSVSEIWEEGYAMKEINKRLAELLERKEDLEKRRKRLTQQKRQAKKSNNAGSSASCSSSNVTSGPSAGGNDDEEGEFDLELAAEAEAIRSHLEQLKRDEMALSEERKLLESEKAVHQKELKRCQSEERSRFYRDLPCLNSRYLLVSLLGRGGFSEVWKALDMLDMKEVAVKVHQLNPAWTEDRKQSYIKHVTREYTIHREMKHPRVVQLFDVFEIDVNSFATVLEYCKGIDLDEKLKRHKIIAEKEVRTIVLQILSGLKYLNTPSAPSQSQSENNFCDESPDAVVPSSVVPAVNSSAVRRKAIIHFDLKPANILFDEMGDAKITDFGLSKVIDDCDESTSMELTSQGAGTYWYLPPECFGRGDGPPRISSKVDVWSLGVIMYQMLYGKRPFGEGKSQEKVLSEGIILNAGRIDFPSDQKGIKVSEDAKDFMKACLTADQRLRPDVFALCQYPFLRNVK